MKVVSAKQMQKIEALSIKEGASDVGYMEQAGKKIAFFVDAFIQKKRLSPHIALLCGKGNNAGDAYVMGRILLQKGYRVLAIQCFALETCRFLCRENYQRFLELGGEVIFLKSLDGFQLDVSLCIDALMGTGFKGRLEGVLGDFVDHINGLNIPIISVDIPSGVDGNSGDVLGPAIYAQHTLFLGQPKMGCFLQKSWDHVGKLSCIDFGLGKNYIDQMQQDGIMMTKKNVQAFLPKIFPSRHKYEAGYVLALCGSKGMSGAAILCCRAALKTGAGIVCLFHPQKMEQELLLAPLELLRRTYQEAPFDALQGEIKRASALVMGPGLSKSNEAKKVLEFSLENLNVPCVLDADALNLIAERGKNFSYPKQTVVTPHKKEMERLLQLKGPVKIDGHFLSLCQNYVDEKKITLVLKGGPSFVFHPHQCPWINPRGDAGMATAGTGDVLAGMIASLMAQKAPPFEAAVLGVYLHALCGEYASLKKTSYCMLASDLLDSLPKAFREIMKAD